MNTRQLFLRFIPTFLGFPLGGLIARLVLGPIDTSLLALTGGAIVGLTVGGTQYLALRPLNIGTNWVWGTALALAVSGFFVALVFGYDTDPSSLAIKGAITGIAFGAVLSVLQKFSTLHFLLWSIGNSAAWALAWVITSLVIVDEEYRYAVFGSSGALVLTIILAFLLQIIFLTPLNKIAKKS